MITTDDNKDYFLIIESKSTELQIKIDWIDSMKETKDGKVNMIYTLIKGEEKMKRNDIFEIPDSQLLLKTYFAIKQKLQSASPRKIGLQINTGAF
jgi:hypothetical protein